MKTQCNIVDVGHLSKVGSKLSESPLGEELKATSSVLCCTSNKVTDLTPAEAEEKARCESLIQTCRLSFLHMGLALRDIRDQRLYRAEYNTFEKYCRERWGWSRARVYQLIVAAETAKAMSTRVDIQPHCEKQIRPLIRLPEEKRIQAWKTACENAGGENVSAKQVRMAVDSCLVMTANKLKPMGARAVISDPSYCQAIDSLKAKERIAILLINELKKWPKAEQDVFTDCLRELVHEFATALDESEP